MIIGVACTEVSDRALQAPCCGFDSHPFHQINDAGSSSG